MAVERIWTVVRFPDGSWSYGGSPTSPDYKHCEVWQISAEFAGDAVKKAQAKRSREQRKKRAVAAGVPGTSNDQGKEARDAD